MKLKFKHQQYQAEAAAAVVDCFADQPKHDGITYRIDPGRFAPRTAAPNDDLFAEQEPVNKSAIADEEVGFRNCELVISGDRLLLNLQRVQERNNLPPSDSLDRELGTFNFDIEMETGTGKTYVYIKTMFELHRLYGWGKFIVIVPSIAIREGVYKSFQITAEHFMEEYGEKAHFFIYNSKQLHEVETFSSNAGLNVMIINLQAFNARGNDARRIYDELDSFQSRRPIDVIAANRPILIIDEPQKMEGKVTKESLPKFNPLFILRYSATHKNLRNQVYRLDAIDAYNQKLVKKIAVKGINVRGQCGTGCYMYLTSVFPRPGEKPAAKLEIEVKQASGISRKTLLIEYKDRIFDKSNGLQQYEDYVVENIDVVANTLTFSNGVVMTSGDATGDVTESILRRIQIREAIASHLHRETELFSHGIKTLSLFFIDEVAKYRQYIGGVATPGEYATIFEEEYQNSVNEALSSLTLSSELAEYFAYLRKIDASKTHNGYFAIDKQKHLVDPKAKGGDKEADDADAYDLILKDKERLLSLDEPTRFIFSHSALREGWDNPNVFVICPLKHSDNTISRRQEVGRGLRLCVNRIGERMDSTVCQNVHEFNVLSVITDESYEGFVSGLQKELAEAVSARPKVADKNYFVGKALNETERIDKIMAGAIYKYLVKNDYVDDEDHISNVFIEARKANTVTQLPDELLPHTKRIFDLLDSIYSGAKLPGLENDRATVKNTINSRNFDKIEFKELWKKINHKAAYTVDFDSNELIDNAVYALDRELKVAAANYTVTEGEQADQLDYDSLEEHTTFDMIRQRTDRLKYSVHSQVPYDLLHEITERTKLTRRTVCAILRGVNLNTFSMYKLNPESFIAKASLLINEQKAAKVIEHLTYHPLGSTFNQSIFTEGQINTTSARVIEVEKSVLRYVACDSQVEAEFLEQLDKAVEVCVYSKLPKGFFIPTPVGDYNPDWAIAFKVGNVRHIYFVAETKGSMSSMQLSAIEKSKIDCARKFFVALNQDNLQYDVINDYGELMNLILAEPTVDPNFILPDMPREIQSDPDYTNELVASILQQGSGTLNFRQLTSAYALLANRDLMAEYAEKSHSNEYREWENHNNQPLPRATLVTVLQGLLNDGLISVNQANEGEITLIADSAPDNAWIQADAKLALAVASTIAPNEIQKQPVLQKLFKEVENWAAVA